MSGNPKKMKSYCRFTDSYHSQSNNVIIEFKQKNQFRHLEHAMHTVNGITSTASEGHSLLCVTVSFKRLRFEKNLLSEDHPWAFLYGRLVECSAHHIVLPQDVQGLVTLPFTCNCYVCGFIRF